MRKQVFIFYFLLSTFCVTAQKDWQLSIQTWTFHKYSFLESVEKAYSLMVQSL